MKYIIIVICVTLLSSTCRKKKENPCLNTIPNKAEFATYELIGDTLLLADTIFNDNPVVFKALQSYNSVSWKIGNDPRPFTSPEFMLRFFNVLETLDVKFEAQKTPNTICFPNDNGIYNATKKITMVDQFDRTKLTVSPIVGNFQGAFTETPFDTFTVKVQYLDSAKYDPGLTGLRNFYNVSNFPKNYVSNNTNLILRYPELKNGSRAEMGYKSFQFGVLGEGDRGRCIGELKQDSLIIYNVITVVINNTIINKHRKFIGKRL